MRPLYIVGTQRHAGKTTFCIGLITALRQRGLTVGYTKPLGQRVTNVAGQAIHDDALVVSKALNIRSEESKSMAIALTRGRVEKEIYDLKAPQLAGKVLKTCQTLQRENDVVVVEGMGHVAMGSCLKMSAAEVAKIVNAKALLISGGGIGRAVDEVSLCQTFLTARGADFLGVVVNKIWPSKFTRISQAVRKGLDNIDIRMFGAVPYEETLAQPTVRQVGDELDAEVFSGAEALDNRTGKTVVAAMEARHMVAHLSDRALVITPGDRTDNILAILSTHALDGPRTNPISGIVLTGGFRPKGKMLDLLHETHLPTLLCKEDTFTIAAKLQETIFKILPEDHERIQTAMCLINEYVDVDAILEALQE
jgi:BioD-like phosphotransacetylase family protein